MTTDKRTIHVQDELAEGFEPSPLPPIGPDGSLEIPPFVKAPEPPPRLCEYGPCEHYHRFRIQMEVGQPRPVKGPGGELVQPPQDIRFQTHHYCYPETGGGIEMELGALPVVECNRFRCQTGTRTAEYLDLHTRRMADWLLERQAEQKRHAELEKEAAADLAAMPSDELFVNVVLWIDGEIQGRRVRLETVWNELLHSIIDRALAQLYPTQTTAPASAYAATVGTDGVKQRALHIKTTVAQAGLGKGDVIDIRPKKGTSR